VNILPTLSTRWSGVNFTMSQLSFEFVAPGYAEAQITIDEVASLIDTAIVRCVIEPQQSGYDAEVVLTLRIKAVEVEDVIYCFLVNNRGGFCEIPIRLPVGFYDSFDVIIDAKTPCFIQRLSVEMITQDIETIINELRQNIPRIVADYNTHDIEIDHYETTVALITATLLRRIDAAGYVALSYETPGSARVVFRMYDDRHKALFSPIIENVGPGKHSFGFPHTYLKSNAGFHNFYVTMQCEVGAALVDTRSVIYFIDAAHLAIRELDTGTEIHDFTARTMPQRPDPSVFYTIGMFQDNAMVRHAYPTTIGITEWTSDFMIQNVSEVAIEFNAQWFATADGRRYITDEFPHICYIDKTGDLYIQHFQSSSTRILLASNATKVAMLRGWLYQDAAVINDVGLLVAYIKTDGNAYYRRFFNNAGTFIWENEQVLPFSVAAIRPFKTITINRVNDFRVVFSVTDDDGFGFSLLTRRYYQANSVENVNIFTFCELDVTLASPMDPQIVAIHPSEDNDYETIVYFNESMVSAEWDMVNWQPLPPLVGLQGRMAIRDSQNRLRTVSATRPLDITNTAMVLTHTAYLPDSHGTGQFILNAQTPHNIFLWAENNGAKFPLPGGTYNFVIPDTAARLSGYLSERVEATSNLNVALYLVGDYSAYHKENVEATCTLNIALPMVTYKNGYTSENLEASCILNVGLLHVGTVPL